MELLFSIIKCKVLKTRAFSINMNCNYLLGSAGGFGMIRGTLVDFGKRSLVFKKCLETISFAVVAEGFIVITRLTASGLPEPGLAMYGSYCGSGIPTSVTWQVSFGTNTVQVSSTLVVVNGQYWYVARVPFETLSLGGTPMFSPLPDTLELNQSPVTYTRSVIINGTNGVVVNSIRGAGNSFSFGAADRGRFDRVDITLPTSQTFAQWLAQYGLPPNSDPNSDPLGKGITLGQEFIAGINPTDPASALVFGSILPTPQGISLVWPSAQGRTYTLSRSTNLTAAFVPIRGPIAATPPTNTVVDQEAVGPGPYFYRLNVTD